MLTAIIDLGLGRVLGIVLAFASLTLIARNLSPTDLGVFSLIVSYYGYLALFSECGLRTAAIAEASRSNSSAAVVPAYLKLRLLIAGGGLAPALGIAMVLAPVYLVTTSVILASVIIQSFQIDWLFIVAQRYRMAAMVNLLRPFVYFALIAMVVSWGRLQLDTLALIFTVSWAAGHFLTWIVAWQQKFELTNASGSRPRELRRLFALSWPVLGTSLCFQLLQNSDLLWIGAIRGKASAGHYYLANTMITASLMLANVICQIAVARYSRLAGDHHRFCRQLRNDVWLISAICCLLALLISTLAPPVIPMVFGRKFTRASTLVVWFIPYLFAYHIATLYYSCGIAIGIQKRLLAALGGALVVLPVVLTGATYLGGIKAFALGKSIYTLGFWAAIYLAMPKGYRYATPFLLPIAFAVVAMGWLWLVPGLSE